MSGTDDTKPPTASVDALLREAQEMMRDEDLVEALELLQVAARLDPDRFEVEGYVDMVRSRLLKQYRERVGDLAAVPRMRVERHQVTSYNLPPDAGFLLSLVDGSTSVEQLVSLSGMAAFEAFRILTNLLDAGIVEVEA